MQYWWFSVIPSFLQVSQYSKHNLKSTLIVLPGNGSWIRDAYSVFTSSSLIIELISVPDSPWNKIELWEFAIKCSKSGSFTYNW